MEWLHTQLWMLLSCVLVCLHTTVFSLLRFLPCVIDTVFCQLDSSATSWRDQGLFQHLLQAVVVKSVCEPRLTYACSDVVYVAETAMCTETKVFSVEYMHGQEEMATKQQYAACKMHIAVVLSHERVNCHEPPTPKPQFAACMMHNTSCKRPCSGNKRSLFHIEWNFSDLQMLHVLACT